MKSKIKKLDKPVEAKDVKPDQTKSLPSGRKFLELIVKLSPEQFTALAKILDVRVLTDEIDPETKKAVPRDAYDIIDDCIDHFALLNRADKRFILNYLKREIKKG